MAGAADEGVAARAPRAGARPPFAERFELRASLGSGTFGVVFEAFDREREAVVALKVLRRANADALYRFKREFRTLADIHHPNLVSLYELLADGDEWSFTMERVRGTTFREHVRRVVVAGSTPGADISEDATTSLGSDGSTWLETAPCSPPSSVAAGAPEPGGMGATPAPAPAPAAAPAPPPPRALPPAVCDEARLRSALRQLAGGIAALHEAGKLHRDLKPANVLVTTEGRVVILDFGIAADLGPGAVAAETLIHFIGTPAYMSPEQAAGQPAGPAADWYSVGVMLYEALTGVLPFVGMVEEVLARKQLVDPRPPDALVRDAPPDLARLAVELLRRAPEERPSGREVLARLDAALPDGPATGPAPATVATAGAAPFFVGRERELARLLAGFEATHGGRAAAFVVHGGSGMGKSALVRRFVDDVRRRDPATVTLAGRCYERESVPYKALDGAIDALSRHLASLAAERAEGLLPRDIHALSRLFPVLSRVQAVEGAKRRGIEIPDAAELRRRGAAALRELLARLAASAPLVLAIDDVQWGDRDSAALLHDLVRPPDPPPLVLVVACRSDDLETSPVVAEVRRLGAGRGSGAPLLDEVDVGALEADTARSLALELLGAGGDGEASADAGATAEGIAREALGNPFFIAELVEHARSGLAGGGASPRSPADGAALDQAVRARVAHLPEPARRLLEVIALFGRPMDLGLATRVADLGDAGPGALAALRAGRLVRLRGAEGGLDPGTQVEAYHDRIREAVVAGITPDLARKAHRLLARALEAAGSAAADPATLLAEDLDAGDRAQAAPLAEAAADRAARALAFDRAAELYRLALDLGAGERAGGSPTRLRAKLAEALTNARRGPEAALVYRAAARETSGLEALELDRRAAELLLLAGRGDEGLAVLEGVLAAAGLTFPRSAWRAIAALLLGRARVRLRGLGFAERAEKDLSPETLFRIDLAWSVAIGLGMLDTLRGAVFQARHLLLALDAGEPYRVARALGLEAVYRSTNGWRGPRTARAICAAMRALAERIGRPHALALALLTEAGVAFTEGAWRESAEHYRVAGEILRERCTGVTWELTSADTYGLASLCYLGEWAELARRLPPVLQDAEARRDPYTLTALRTRGLYLLRLAADDPERARAEVGQQPEWSARLGTHLHHFRRVAAEADIALYAGAGREELEALVTRLTAVGRTALRYVQIYRIELLYARARCALAAGAAAARTTAAAAGGGAGAARDRNLRAAARDARAIERERAPWADPMVDLVRASIAAFGGDARAAAAGLGAASAGFTRAHMAIHAAAAARRLGEVEGGAAGEARIATADALLAAQGIVRPARVADLMAPWP